MRRPLFALVAMATLLLGGCGIPDDSGVTVVGPAPSLGTSVGDDGTVPVQHTRESSPYPDQFVDNFLQAAAGDPVGAQARVKEFLSPEAAAGFRPITTNVQVVHLVKTPLINPGVPEVTLTVQTVGMLRPNGLLDPYPDSTPTQENLVIGEVAGKNGLFVKAAPQKLLLSDTALQTFYQQHKIYFWNAENTGLVPDVRYMPLSVPTVQRPTTILNWLAGGPADWLRGSVLPLPQNAAAQDNVPAISDDKLQINLNQAAVPPGDDRALDRLRRQLQWSLRSLLPRTLEIKIGHQDPVRYADTEFLNSNAAYRLADVPERFVVYGGVIHRLAQTPHAADPVPVLKPEANRNVLTAAMSSSRTHTFAAVVVRTGDKQSLRVGSARTGEQADLKPVAGLIGTLGHPVWAVATDGAPDGAIGLVTVDGRLYSFGTDGSPGQPIDWQGNPGAVTSVSVAPDGYRVALVAGGRLYRTVLTTNGDGVSLSPPEQIMPLTLHTVTAVAWSSEGWLAIAGVRPDDRVSVGDITIDGTQFSSRLDDIGNSPVTYLTAYPANPIARLQNSNSESYMTADGVWDVLAAPVPITVADLVGPPTAPQPGVTPTAPFFLE